jgi:hypothetical protein
MYQLAGQTATSNAINPIPAPPVSVRLSAPLLAALDRLSHEQHRKRGNLIQHILWEYVQANSK